METLKELRMREDPHERGDNTETTVRHCIVTVRNMRRCEGGYGELFGAWQIYQDR